MRGSRGLIDGIKTGSVVALIVLGASCASVDAEDPRFSELIVAPSAYDGGRAPRRGVRAEGGECL